MAGSRENSHFRFGDPPLIDGATSVSAGNMPAGIPSPTIDHAITDSGQSASSAPVTTNIWAATSSPDTLDYQQGLNLAARTQSMAAYGSISSQGRTPLAHGRPPFGNTAAALGGHDGLFQATINSGQSASSASVAANIWAATSSPDTLDYQQGLNLAARTQSMAAYDSTLPAYMLVPPVFPSYFQQLPKEIQALFGVEITPNALVKRFGKLQDQYFGGKKAMPDLVAAVKDKMACMDLRLSETEKKAMEDILKELPQIIPRFVQHRVMQKRKGMDK
ncbi:hypothetical protein DL771_007351 [Monosporascus sp. 5C6A]|nr:hypothetical protein DL771_007351 [Monosporascus sp. 5C6A]